MVAEGDTWRAIQVNGDWRRLASKIFRNKSR